MSAERDFWRLLAEYERLTRDESFSLKSEDFAEVDALQNCKDTVLEKLEALAGEAGLDRRNAELARRIDVLIEIERQNEKRVGAMIARDAAQTRSMDAARLRLRRLGNIYVREKSELGAFSAFV